jgi:hypothetical protein
MLRDAPQASHFTHRFSVCNEAPLSKKRSVPLHGLLTTVDEVVPRKIVEVAVAACQEETRRNGIGILRGLVALGATTSLVDEAGSLRSEAVFLDLEQPRVEG